MKQNYFRNFLIFLCLSLTGLNSKAQNFQEITPNDLSPEITISSVAFADIDGDNDEDLIMTGEDNYNNPVTRLYRNEGGVFTLVSNASLVNVSNGDVAFADVDGDGDQDLLITGTYKNFSGYFMPIANLYKNDGVGNFSIAVSFEGVQSSSVAFADIDNDNDPDLLITGRTNSNVKVARIYTNDGAGNFSLDSQSQLEGVDNGSIALADVDNDGFKDLLLTGRNSANVPVSYLYRNVGGIFSLIPATPFPGVYFSSVAFADIDGDNYSDILITGMGALDHVTEIYSNDGSGNFSLKPEPSMQPVRNSSVAFADVDGDFDEDVIITGSTPSGYSSILYINNGNGDFSAYNNSSLPGVYNAAIAFADIDGDNDPDLLLAGVASSGPVTRLYENYQDPCLDDQISPTAIANDITIFLNENGNASITAEEVGAGSSDNCSDITFEVDKLVFNCSDLGANPVTLTVKDESGNSSTAEAIITVEDKIAPQAFCDSSTPIQNVAIISNSTFGNSLDTSLVNSGYNVTYNGAIPPSPEILATTDAVFLIRIEGNQDLATWVQNGGVLITEWFASNWALNTANLIDATDNGGGHVGNDTKIAFTGTAIGQSLGTNLPNPYSDGGATEFFRNFTELGETVEIHATRPGDIPVIIGDNAGLGYVLAIGYDYQDVTNNLSGSNTERLILNSLSANYIAPLVFQLDENGLASITAADIDNNSVDNCGIATISVFPDSFDCSNIGANTVTLTLTDESGNSTTCNRTIIIEDNIAPTITCPSEIIQPNDEGKDNAVVHYDVPTSDNCSNETIIQTEGLPSGSTFPLGTTTNTFEVTDAHGNKSTCSFDVTVNDVEAPSGYSVNIDQAEIDEINESALSFTVTGAEVGATYNYTISSSEGEAEITGTGTISTATQQISGIDVSALEDGTLTLSITLTDSSGNTGEVVTDTVEKATNTLPEAICKNFTAQLEEDGTVTISPEDVDGGSQDAEGDVTLSLDVDTFDCSDLGEKTVTLTVTDSHGETATCTATVTVEDNMAPVVVTQNITVQLDAEGNASITPEQIDNGSADACGIAEMSLDITTFDCSDIGQNTITLTVTDNNGNTISAEATVTVEDSVAPVVVTQNITVQLDAEGNASITPAMIDNGSADACGISEMSLDITTFDCSNVDQNTVTLTVTDNNGNESSAEATVTVEDSVAPVVVTQNITVQLNAEGNATITPAMIDNGSADACGIAEISLDITTFDCFNVGENTVTLTVTDNNGNESSAEATVTVEDSVAPVVVTQNITVQLDAEGNASITPAEIDNSSADACGISEMSLDITIFDCSNVGENTVSLTVIDNNGNESSAEATVTVEDSVAPVVVTQNITVQLDAEGNASITPEEIDNGSADACGIAEMSLDITTFDCSNVGENTVSLTVIDNNGNESSAEATVTVEDSVAPVVVTQNITVQLDAQGNATITPEQIDNGSADACGISEMSLDITIFDCSNVGENTVSLTVIDNNGNESSAEATVTVEDSVAPVVVTQNITVQLDAEGNATIIPELIDNGSADACGISEMSLDNAIFDCSNMGENTVTLTVTDNNGNLASAEAIVTVEDSVAPVVVTQNITIQLDAEGNATITPEQIDNGSADACGISEMSLDNAIFDCSNMGENTVTLTVTDNNGNLASAEATVTVEDSGAPVVVTQNITVQLDAEGNASITPAMIDNNSADACGIAEMSLDITTFDCSNVGENTVTLKVTDNNGNIASAEAIVTVEDSVAPVVVTQNITVQLDAEGNASITPEMIDNGSADACGIAEMSLDITTFDCSNVGENTVTLTVTDNNGNESSAEATVTVEDSVAPVVVTQNITVQLDAEGNASITPEMIDNGSADACGIAEMSLDITTFDCSNVGENTVILTVIDNNGNESSAEATVTVEDSGAPVVVTQNITVQLDALGNASITPEEIDNGSADACGISEISLDNTTFDCSNVGENTVTLTVTDNNGNESSAEATVTVEDSGAPVVVTQNITVQLDAEGNVSISPEQIDNGSADACGTSEMSLDNATFDCSNVGENTVTLTVTDNNGNESSAEATVTVEDSVAPVVVTQNITVQLDAQGNASITPEEIDNGSADACRISEMSLDNAIFDCSNMGENTVTLTVIDNNGNESSAEATVTVEDNVAPVVVTRDISIEVNESGMAVITAEDVVESATDNCGIDNVTLSRDLFDCTAGVESEVTVTVTDINGNSTTATAKVSVVDEMAPVVVARDIVVELDKTGVAIISPEDIFEDAIDNCGIDSMSLDISSFGCDELGSNIVVLSVTDLSGNTATVEAIVEVRKQPGSFACEPEQLRASEAMTPNGDGINDTWRVVDIEDHPNSLVIIYNRWGKEVFRQSSYKNDWDGRYNGDMLPEGSYYFQIYLDGKNMDKDGWLYLTK